MSAAVDWSAVGAIAAVIAVPVAIGFGVWGVIHARKADRRLAESEARAAAREEQATLAGVEWSFRHELRPYAGKGDPSWRHLQSVWKVRTFGSTRCALAGGRADRLMATGSLTTLPVLPGLESLRYRFNSTRRDVQSRWLGREKIPRSRR
jgi:hypothetical protein